MRLGLRTFLRRYLQHKALVLLYHRVAEPATDVWETAVSTANFEQQLRILKKTSYVLPLEELVEKTRRGILKHNSIALTFDDGYANNYEVALPLLEKYKLPATFFISSGYVDSPQAFWWDELEHLILLTEKLPNCNSITINKQLIEVDLQGEAYLDEARQKMNRSWKACTQPPPTQRAKLYLQLWQQLKPLPATAQQQYLQQIREWAKPDLELPPPAGAMSAAQLKKLAQHHLCTVGAHTVTHPALAMHPLQVQQNELQQNKQFLQMATGQKVSMLAYPYGSYNQDTIAAAEAIFSAAFTTEEKGFTQKSHLYRLGRIPVTDLSAAAFENMLCYWKHKV